MEPNWFKAGLALGKGQLKFIEENDGMALDDYVVIEDIQDKLRHTVSGLHSFKLANDMDGKVISEDLLMKLFGE